jgi:arylsulfatase A-like enzyme
MLTGRYGLTNDTYPSLASDRPTLARSIQSHGIETAGFTTNPFLSRAFGYDAGFDIFRDYQNIFERTGAKVFPNGLERPSERFKRINDVVPILPLAKKTYRVVAGQSRPYVSATRVVDDVTDYLDSTSRPFFCWAHLMDIHHPCYPPVEYRRRHDVATDITEREVEQMYSRFVAEADALAESDVATLKKLYRAAIDYVDDELERVFECMSTNGLLEKTTVIVTSDHGELFGEHGQYNKPARLYDELVQVPFVISQPPAILRDQDLELFSLIDLPPLIHDVLGVPPEPDMGEHSPAELSERDHVLLEEFRNGEVLLASRSLDWRFEIDHIRGERAVYDLRNGEVTRRDIGSVDDATVDHLEQRAESHLNRIAAEHADVDVSKEVRERLNTLGYLE